MTPVKGVNPDKSLDCDGLTDNWCRVSSFMSM